MVKISKLLKKFGIIDETILELKKEVSHLNSWTSSWTFSRILLYLYNILGCLTYNYNMNREQFQKTDFKQWFRLVKRTYYYVKLVMEILLIKFDGEEIDAFHRLRREFRTHLQEKINKVTEERLRQLNENVSNKIDENRKDWLREKDIIKQRKNQEIANLEPLLMKKVKGSQSFGLIPNTNSKEKKRKSLDEENYESSGSEEYKIKTKRTLEEKLAPVKKKKQKQGALKENELKFKILIGKSLQECLNKVTNHYKS